VKAGEHQEPICELELELLAGETADLLRLMIPARGFAQAPLTQDAALQQTLREAQQIGGLPGDVQPLFSTDFARERWVIQEGKSEIEIALDRGEVKDAGRRSPANAARSAADRRSPRRATPAPARRSAPDVQHRFCP
jgi:inorganic triphosphatase YgiF